MKDWVNELIVGHKYVLEEDPRKREVMPRVYCNDGYNVSIQANSFAYCEPRIDDSPMGYTKVELGFPSSIDDEFKPYAEDEGDWTNTVYAYVPTDIVNKVIERHGGIDYLKWLTDDRVFKF